MASVSKNINWKTCFIRDLCVGKRKLVILMFTKFSKLTTHTELYNASVF